MFKQIDREEALKSHPILAQFFAPFIVGSAPDPYTRNDVSLEVEHDPAELPQPVEVGSGNWAKAMSKGVPALKAALHAHGDSTVSQLVGQHEEMHGAANMTAMKKLATEHLAKTIAHHTDHLGKIHGHIDKAITASPESASGLKKLKKMAQDHHDQTMDLHKAHHAEMHSASNHAAMKTLATGHLAKILTHHCDGFEKMFDQCDKLQAAQKVADPQSATGNGFDTNKVIADLAKAVTSPFDVSELFVHEAAPKVAFNSDFSKLWDRFRLFGKTACLSEMRKLAIAGA